MIHTRQISRRLQPLWANFSALEEMLANLADSEYCARFSANLNNTGYSIVLQYPGFKKEHVTVELDSDNRVIVNASRPTGKNHDGIEMGLGQSSPYNLYLPDDADPATLAAKMEDGLLTVTVAKTTQPATRKVVVS